MKPLQIMIVLFVLRRYSHVKGTKNETFADNDSGIIYIKEIQPH